MGGPQHFLTIEGIEPEWLEEHIRRALLVKKAFKKRRTDPTQWDKIRTLCVGLVMYVLFLEASTRTYGSFVSAFTRLGGQVIPTQNGRKLSSFAKNESDVHAGRVSSGYCDIMAIRHDQAGGVARMATLSKEPVISAGDGNREHPTQALLDCTTIVEEFGNQNHADLTLTVVGDLLNGRTVHSLLELMRAMFGTPIGLVSKVRLVSTPDLALPEELIAALIEAGLEVEEHHELTIDVLSDTDVLYMTRIQTERFAWRKRLTYRFKRSHRKCYLTTELVDAMPGTGIIMHPLPCNAELPPDLDTHPKSRFFQQSDNGVFSRMVLILTLLGLLSQLDEALEGV